MSWVFCGQDGTEDKLQASYIASTALDGKVLFWECTFPLSYQGYLPRVLPFHSWTCLRIALPFQQDHVQDWVCLQRG